MNPILKYCHLLPHNFNDDATDSYIFTPHFHIVKVFQICNRPIYILGLRSQKRGLFRTLSISEIITQLAKELYVTCTDYLPGSLTCCCCCSTAILMVSTNRFNSQLVYITDQDQILVKPTRELSQCAHCLLSQCNCKINKNKKNICFTSINSSISYSL